jgi:uncharacterized protein YoxC
LNTRDWIEVVLAGLLVLNLLIMGVGVAVALNRIGGMKTQVEDFLKKMLEELTVTLQQTHDALARVEMLAQSGDKLVREEVAPTLQVTRAALSHVETTTRSLSEGVQGVRRIVGAVEAASAPAALAAGISRGLGQSKSKAGLLALILGVGASLLLTRGRKR